MTAYVSNHRKKKETLTRREADLLRSVERGDSPEKLLKAAEAVRDAQIRVFECQLSLVPPCDDAEKDREDRIRRHLEEWQSRTAQEILDSVVEGNRTQPAVAE